MYSTLVRYFYYLYYVKSNKTYKYLVLFDIFYHVFKYFLRIKRVQLKYNKYKSLVKTGEYLRSIVFRRYKFYKKMIFYYLDYFGLNRFFKKSLIRNLFLIRKFFLKDKEKKKNVLSHYVLGKNKNDKNDKKKILYYKQKYTNFSSSLLKNFLKRENINIKNLLLRHLPSNIVPRGSRKRLYRFFQKRYKRFFYQIKKKNLNPLAINKFFLGFLKKIKEQFIVLSAKKNYDFDVRNLLSNLFFGMSFSSLKKECKVFNVNREIADFYPFLDFFYHRVDFFLRKIFPFFSLQTIRSLIKNENIVLNNKYLKSFSTFLKNHDFLKFFKTNNYYFSNLKVIIIDFYLRNFSSNCYKDFYNLQKKTYYRVLYFFLKKNITLCNKFFFLKKWNWNSFKSKLNVLSTNHVTNSNFLCKDKDKDVNEFFSKFNLYFYGNGYVVKNHKNQTNSNLFLNYKQLENYQYLHDLLYFYNNIYYIFYKDKLVISLSMKKYVVDYDKHFYYIIKELFNV